MACSTLAGEYLNRRDWLNNVPMFDENDRAVAAIFVSADAVGRIGYPSFRTQLDRRPVMSHGRQPRCHLVMRLLVDRLSLGILAVVSAYDATVRAFAAAARAGDLAALVSVLDPDVVPRQDGGGIVNVARQQVQGADRVARFLLRALEGNPTMEVFDQETPDGLGFAMWIEGRVSGVVTMDVAGDKVTDVRMVVNPEKLALWN